MFERQPGAASNTTRPKASPAMLHLQNATRMDYLPASASVGLALVSSAQPGSAPSALLVTPMIIEKRLVDPLAPPETLGGAMPVFD